MKKRLSIILIGVLVWSGLFGQEGNQATYNQQKSQGVRAYSDFATLEEGETVVVYVLTNDVGVSDGIASLEIIKQPETITAVVIDNSYIKLTSTPGIYGDDELTYKVCSKSGDCDEAKVIIEVVDYDFIPIANSDTVLLKPAEVLETNILLNDENLFDTPITVEIINDTYKGVSELNDSLLTVTFSHTFRGKDSLQYRVCDAEGDCDIAWVVFKVKADVRDDIFIPQGISPNGDGLNDEFVIPDLQGAVMQIKIFNVSGQLVYSDANYQNNWNGLANKGRYTGSIVENGTYYFSLSVSSYNEAFSGYIYLTR